MRRRGVTDFGDVMIDPWSVGYNGPEDAAGQGRPVVELEFLYSARSLADRLEKQRLLRDLFGWVAMPDRAYDRAGEIQQRLTETGQHHSAGHVDILIGRSRTQRRQRFTPKVHRVVSRWSMPDVGFQGGLEVGAAFAQPVHHRMLRRYHSRPAGTQDAAELGECGPTVAGIVNGQRADDAADG